MRVSIRFLETLFRRSALSREEDPMTEPTVRISPFLWLVAVAVIIGPASARGQEPRLGHFKCYQTLGNPIDQPVRTEDQFDIKEGTGFEPTFVRQAVRFCNPVEKIHKRTVSEIPDRRAHLTMYVTAPTDTTALRVVTIDNQFGKTRIRTFSSPILATPTEKNNEGFPEDLDHYKCYRAYGRPVNTVVTLRDQFHVEQGVKVGYPILFCNPTRKIDAAGVAFGVKNATDHLTCYQISRQPFEKSISALDQFGLQQLRVRDADLLCAPTAKLAWERLQ
jgi:hypothetical protein